MDEARAQCAIDISGRPYALFEAELPPGATGRLRARAHRGVLPRVAQRAPSSRCTSGAGRHQRPPHDRGGVQGVRASAAQAVAIDPTETGVPSTKGTLT